MPSILEPGLEVGEGYRLVRLITEGEYETWEVYSERSHSPLFAKLHYSGKRAGDELEFELLDLELEAEANRLAALRSEFVAGYYDSFSLDLTVGDKVHRVSGTLFTFARHSSLTAFMTSPDRLRMSEGEELHFLMLLAEGIGDIHDQGFAHNDIRPGSILVDGEPGQFVPLYAKFGTPRALRRQRRRREEAPSPAIHYIAPERLAGEPGGPEGDIYALGVLFYRFLSQRELGAIWRPTAFLDLDLQAGPDAHDASLGRVRYELRALLTWMLNSNPEGRPTAQDVVARLEQVLADVSDTPDIVPRQQPAAIRPTWRSDSLTTSASPADGVAALAALADILRSLAATLSEASNADPRIPAHVLAIANRIPAATPEIHELYRLGHDQELLAAMLEQARGEWSPVQSASFQAAVSHFDHALHQFSDWAAFKRNVAAAGLSLAQQVLAKPLLGAVTEALRAADTAAMVDPELLGAMDSLAALRSSSSSPAVALDQIESANNTLKALVGALALEGPTRSSKKGAFVRRFLAKFESAVEDEAGVWAKALAETPRKLGGLAVKTVLGGASVAGGYGAIQALSLHFPQFMAWLPNLLKLMT